MSKFQSNIPDGKYVAKFKAEQDYENSVVVSFEITLGEHRATTVYQVLSSSKAKNAIEQRTDDWLSWMQYLGDAKASKIFSAIDGAIDDQFFVKIEDGFVKSVIDPSTSERAYLSMYKEFAEEWQLSSEPQNQPANLNVCKVYFRQTGRLPTTYWDYFPKEKYLGDWLASAIDPNSETYLAEANAWVNEIFKRIGGRKTDLPNKAYDWPKLWLNKGFKEIPPEPR